MISGADGLFRAIKEVLSLEKRTIVMRGPVSAQYLFKYFTKRHPRYKIIRNKALGVALIQLPHEFSAYLEGSHMNNMRNKRKRALKLGYVFRRFKSEDYREDILSINRSADFRQGTEMHHDYKDAEKVDAYLLENPDFYGLFDHENHLRAYIHAMPFGEICIICRILGHAEFAKDGIMYLLISELVRDLILTCPETKYLMYDTIIGATPGLRYFKDQAGFTPFHVRWIWQTVATDIPVKTAIAHIEPS